MKPILLFATGAACGAAALVTIPRAAAHLRAVLHSRSVVWPSARSDARAHTEEKFAFIAIGALEDVAPLFGANRERAWAPDWNPQFVHPLPVSDQAGMVFTVNHGHLQAAWVNTEFDLRNGRIQYAYVIPDVMVTLISLRLIPEGKQTHVQVAYDRTALSPEADEHVRRMAEQDRAAGPEWEKQINDYLARQARPVK